MRNFLFLSFLLFSIVINAQKNSKSINALRVTKAPVIDGNLNDEAWAMAEMAKDFIMFRPGSGEKEPDNQKTEVKVIYDDEAIYFGAYLYDDNINDIPKESATRDNFGQADWFGVILNPYNDGQNDTEFFVQVTGNQADAKVTPDNEDFSWNAVWTSSVKIVEDGWIAEIKIPYSALRFSNDEVQTWGLNIHRRMQGKKEQYSWNFIDKKNGIIGQYSGTVEGL